MGMAPYCRFCVFLTVCLAFKIMSCYSPVTLSVMNTAKRALIICFSAHYFGNVITNTALCGTVVTLLGSGLYSYLKSTIRRTAEDGKDSKMDRSSSATAVATHTTKDSRVRSRLCGSRRFRPKGGAAPGYRYPMLAATVAVAMCSFPYVPPRPLPGDGAQSHRDCRLMLAFSSASGPMQHRVGLHGLTAGSRIRPPCFRP